MIASIKKSLKDQSKLNEFNNVINMAFNLTQKKRYYISDYGYGNVREVINEEQDELVRGHNRYKFHIFCHIFIL